MFGPFMSLALAYAAVFATLGLVMLNIARELPRVGWWAVVRPLGYAQLLLAFVCVFAFVVFAQDSLGQAPCITVPNSSVATGASVSYTWVSSCASVTTPPFFGAFTRVMTWMLLLEGLVFVVIVPMTLFWNMLRGGAA